MDVINDKKLRILVDASAKKSLCQSSAKVADTSSLTLAWIRLYS